LTLLALLPLLSLLPLLTLLPLLSLLTLLPLLSLLTLFALLTLLALFALLTLLALTLLALLAALPLLSLLILTARALATAALRLALGAGLPLPLVSLLTLLAVLVLILLITGLHATTQRFEIVGKLPRSIERIFEPFSTCALGRAALSGLKVLQHFFQIAFDHSLALTCLFVKAVGNQLLILSNAIWNTILTNRSGSLAELVARLLAVLAHATCRLINIAFEAGDLIGKRLLLLSELRFFVIVCGALAASREIINAATDLVLSL